MTFDVIGYKEVMKMLPVKGRAGCPKIDQEQDCVYAGLRRTLAIMQPTQSTGVLIAFGVWCCACGAAQTNAVTYEAVVGAGSVVGLNFTSNKIGMLLPGLREQLGKFETLRK